MMNGFISRYTSELNRLCVCVHYISITSSPISLTCGRSVNNVFPELMTLRIESIYTCPIIVPIKESMLDKPVCPNVSLHLLTTDKMEVLAVPLILTGVTRGVYIKVTNMICGCLATWNSL